MKIVAGMSSVDDYIRLVKAGADEVFCGYVPYEWNKRYQSMFPLNRREVLYYNVQISSIRDMRILKKMVDIYGVPVTITFNSLYYIEEQYEIILDMITDLMNIGFDRFIIADLGLLEYISRKKVKCKIHLSGECAELNHLSMKFFNQFHIKRYIFHRKNTIEDMQSCISMNKEKKLEYEAFILNERCHYTGAFCFSLHCDELVHLCKMPYNISKKDIYSNHFKDVDVRIGDYYDKEDKAYGEDEEQYILGSTGCGLCSLMELRDAGITHLKVVGRGNFIEVMEKDVRNLKEAINMIDNADSYGSYGRAIKERFFKGKCSGECYYFKKEDVH